MNDSNEVATVFVHIEVRLSDSRYHYEGPRGMGYMDLQLPASMKLDGKLFDEALKIAQVNLEADRKRIAMEQAAAEALAAEQARNEILCEADTTE